MPSTLDGLSDASAVASVKTAALVGGPEALKLLARWAPDPRSAVQRALAQVWRYFDPRDYAAAVLRDAPLESGMIQVDVVEHVPHLGTLQHLRDVWLDLINSDAVDGLAFLRDAPPVTTKLQVVVKGPIDLAPLASFPALETLIVWGEVTAGWELLTTLRELSTLVLSAPGGGRDLSFLAECTSLIGVTLHDCTALSDLSALVSALVSASQLRLLQVFGAHHVYDLSHLTRLPHLTGLSIGDAPLTNGVAAVPILDQLTGLSVWRVPTATSLEVLVGSSLERINLNNCPVANLEPLAMLQPLKTLRLQRMPALNLAPLSSLPQLRELTLTDMNEPVDLSPFAQTDHRLRVELWNTPTVGEPGPLVKVRRH